MTVFLDSVEQYFSSRDLYAALGVEKTAKDSELKRAYHRLSLQVHPDRVPPEEVEEATKKFQVLGKVYAVLSDADKRALYDEDGTVDEEDSSVFNQDRDWTQYWRLLFKKVTIEDIKSFERNYKGSDEERETLRSAYLDCEGDMERIIEEVLCATVDDEARFRELISQWIAEGEVPDFPAFSGETEQKRKGRKRKHEEEAREAEQVMREMGVDPDGGGDDDSLKALIQARHQSREAKLDGFFNSLEEKYAKKPKTSKGKKGQTKQSKASSSKGTKAAGTKKGKKK